MSAGCYCDYDAPEFYSASMPRARKRYQCYDCSGHIEIGERHEKAVYKYDGFFNEHRTCERCYDLRIWVKNNVPCFCYLHGGLIETAEEAIEEAVISAPEETVGLRFGFLRRQVLRDRWNRERRAP